LKKPIKYFIQGLLMVVPAAITLLVVFKLASMIASVFSNFGLIIHPWIDPLLVLGSALLLITFIGIIGSNYLLHPILKRIEDAVERAPFLKIVYPIIKDFMSAFVGSKKRFNKPVLVLTDKANNIQRMGFITHTDLSELDVTGKVAVYLPLSYAFSGQMLIVPVECVTPIDIPASEAMKFIVSGGVTDID
jgi:uncharacterized membrane protein